MMLSMTWANVPVASATSPPATSVSISTPYFGTIANNGFAFTSASPNIILNATTPANSTLYSTEYKLGVNGNVTLYQGPFYLNSSTSVIELKYRSNASSGLESWKSLTSIKIWLHSFFIPRIGGKVEIAQSDCTHSSMRNVTSVGGGHRRYCVTRLGQSFECSNIGNRS